MKFGATQFLLLVVCAHLSTQTTIGKVTTRWTYKDNASRDTKSLPDSIQIDLELEGDIITMDLIRQSKEPIKPPLVVVQSEGQRSVWKPSSNEIIGTYKDPALDASATVAIMEIDGIKEIAYTITFSYNTKSFNLEPRTLFLGNPYSDKTNKMEDSNSDEVNNNKNSNNNILFNIDGKLHSLVETPTIKSHLDSNLNEDGVRGLMKESRMRKRSVAIPKNKRLMTVEIFTIIDYSTFKRFFNESKCATYIEKKEEAMKNIFYTFTHVMEGVKDDYEGIVLEGFKFTIKWVGAFVAQSATDVPFIENSKIDRHTVDVEPFFAKLRKWEKNEKAKRNNKTKLPHYDYIAVFTSYGIRKEKSYIGYANGLGIICSGITIGLISNRDIIDTTLTTSHELGHSLGLIHDGESNNCNSSDNFIMANMMQAYSKDTFLNPYHFSNCSLSYFHENIDKLDRSKKNCLADGGEDFNSGRERDVFLHLYPGQIYNLDDQCKMTFGSKSFYCGGDANDEIMCQTIKCSEAGYCKATFLKALDGTSCSSGSWCRRGKCVADRRAPRAPKRCVNGDRRKYYYPPNVRTSWCDQVNKNRTMCYQSPHKDLCCASCAGTQIYGGCQDTISECSSLEPKDCYSNYYATTCCKTCETLVKNPSDTACLYGDRGDSCSDMVPGVCYLKTRFCCQTCSAYLSSPNRTSSFPKEYGKTLEYVDVWGRIFYLNCTQLVNRDSSLCYYDEVQRYCYDSCRSVELVKDYCIDGDYKGLLTYRSKKFSCEELVKYNPSLCEKKDIKNQCCESCANFIIRPLSSEMLD